MSILPNPEGTYATRQQSWRAHHLQQAMSGSSAKLKVDDYLQRKNPDTSMDASHALNTTETRLCKIFATVEVERKLGHTVPEPLQQKTEAALLATACQMC